VGRGRRASVLALDQIGRGLVKAGATPPAELGRLSPDLGAHGGPSPLLATGADRFVLFDSMLRFLRDTAGKEPLLLVFDDLHAADAATVQMLGFIAPELRDERVLVVGTFRDVEARLQPSIVDALAAVGRAGEVVRLQRLGRAEVAAIAREYVALDEVDVDALFAKTEGNPLFVGETARVLAAEGRSASGALPLSDGVRAAIRAHLDRVTAERRRDLELAAVVGREFAATVLAPLVEIPVAELVGRLSEAAAAGFLVERMPSRFAFEAEAHHDPGPLARVQGEIDALAAELSRGIGLSGRARRSGRAAERARVNVQRRLAEAIRRIEEAHGPLGAHLRKAIRTGAFCSYAPERGERE
jgi:hypothetical protein